MKKFVLVVMLICLNISISPKAAYTELTPVSLPLIHDGVTFDGAMKFVYHPTGNINVVYFKNPQFNPAYNDTNGIYVITHEDRYMPATNDSDWRMANDANQGYGGTQRIDLNSYGNNPYTNPYPYVNCPFDQNFWSSFPITIPSEWEPFNSCGNMIQPGSTVFPSIWRPLPFSYNNLTYSKKVTGFAFNSTCTGYERELYTPTNSGIWIYHTKLEPRGDFLATGVFTGNATETISAHEGALESQPFHNNIQLNEIKNCFATVKSNVDIKWTTNYGQYGSVDNCGNYHEEGDLIVPKNLNSDGTIPISCIFPVYCAFPDFTNVGANIRDTNHTSDFVITTDVFNGVSSFLNSKNDGSGDGSYYQCTEYVARYLHSKFDTDYSDSKNVNDANAQGFRGYDFHPNYGGNPTVDKGGNVVSLALVSPPRIGDVAMFSSRHSAVVKSVDGTVATLIEQNYIINNTYTKNRTIDTSALNVTFYRYPAVVIENVNSISSTIQDAYDSLTINDQSIRMQTQTFNEDLVFSNDVSVTLRGGYDPAFQTASGFTTIFGSLTIRFGAVVAENICIQ